MKNTEKPAVKVKECQHCEYNGIVYNAHFKELGEAPLSPCPRCVLPKCKCGGVDPYYYYENEEIRDCSCRETRMKINTINSIYRRSGIDAHFMWKFFNDFKVKNNLADKAKKAAYDIVRKFPDVKKGLFLWGNPGTGKTLLAHAIAEGLGVTVMTPPSSVVTS